MQTQRDLISVIVPIYNNEPYLEDCIKSLVAQTYTNIEIILVDDGSPDGCPDICDRYVFSDSRILVIHKQNGGLVSARKAGLQKSTGKYIGYVDGDDWVEPVMFEDMYNNIVRSNSDIVASGHKRDLLDSSEIILNAVPPGVYEGEALVNNVFSKMLYNGDFFKHGVNTYVWSKLFKRDILYKHQMCVDERISIGEDAACVFLCMLDAKRVCITDSSHYHYRHHESSILKTIQEPDVELNRIKILDAYLRSSFSVTPFANMMLSQLNYYTLHHITTRSEYVYARSHHLRTYYPFNNTKKGDKVVIYSAGSYGKRLYRQLIGCKDYEVVLWVDPDYRQYQSFGMPVYAPEAIPEVPYDSVIVASLDKTITQRIIEELLGIGVPKGKLSIVEYGMASINDLLNEYGIAAL